MKIKVTKLSLVLFLLILLGPVFDLLTGFTLKITGSANVNNVDAITPGVFYRGLFLIPVFFILAHLLKSKTRLLIYYLGIAFFTGILVRGFRQDNFDLVRDGQRYLKLVLPIIGYTGMIFVGYYFTRNKPKEIYWRMAALYGAMAGFGLLVTDFIGLGLKVYRRTTAASAGLIDSQNAAGLVLIISLPLALFYVYKYRNNSFLWLLLVQGLWLAAAFRLNTRAVLIAVPLVLVIHHGQLFFKGHYTRTNFRTISWVVFLILCSIIVYFILQAWLSRDVGYILDRFELLAAGEFRNRVPRAITLIQGYDLSEHLFGLGDRYFQTKENDLVDIYGKFGLTTFVPIILFYLYFYFRILIGFVQQRQQSTFALLLSMTLYLGHGFIAGHALLSSPVNNLFLLVLFLAYIELKQLKEIKEAELTIDRQPATTPVSGAVPATGKSPLAYDG